MRIKKKYIKNYNECDNHIPFRIHMRIFIPKPKSINSFDAVHLHTVLSKEKEKKLHVIMSHYYKTYFTLQNYDSISNSTSDAKNIIERHTGPDGSEESIIHGRRESFLSLLLPPGVV